MLRTTPDGSDEPVLPTPIGGETAKTGPRRRSDRKIVDLPGTSGSHDAAFTLFTFSRGLQEGRPAVGSSESRHPDRSSRAHGGTRWQGGDDWQGGVSGGGRVAQTAIEAATDGRVERETRN